MFRENIKTSDRVISAFTYATGGTVGIIWMIFCAVTKRPMSKFMLFNIYQSAFLSIFLYLASVLLQMAYNLLIMVPGIKILANIVYITFFTQFFYNWSVIGVMIFLTYVYLIFASIFGKIAYLPWISNIIMYQLGRF